MFIKPSTDNASKRKELLMKKCLIIVLCTLIVLSFLTATTQAQVP